MPLVVTSCAFKIHRASGPGRGQPHRAFRTRVRMRTANLKFGYECSKKQFLTHLILQQSALYKGGGKDPLERGSYRGISVTPVLSKLLDTLILGRLLPVFEDLNIPNINQTGYRKHVSCTDAIFTTTEVLSHYLHESETTYLCCYDLQNAFDSVEYGVLLCRLFCAGINAKLWRLVRAWYQSPQDRSRLVGSSQQHSPWEEVSDRAQFYHHCCFRS